MEKELLRKIEWLEKRHEKTHEMIETIEKDRLLDRSNKSMELLRQAKKEKLRLKDHIAWMKNLKKKLEGEAYKEK